MSLEILLALVGFSFVSSITPGPNNLMLLSSGVNFGFRPTIPHMLGISAGFAFLLACVGLGLGQLLTHFPLAYTMLKFAGGSYLVYLAWRIATSGPIEAGEGGGKPFTFIEAALFQWVNPKAWVMAVTAMATYTNPNAFLPTVFMVVAIFTAVNLPAVSAWCGFGTALRGFLSNPRNLRIFNVLMAILLVASLWPMLR